MFSFHLNCHLGLCVLNGQVSLCMWLPSQHAGRLLRCPVLWIYMYIHHYTCRPGLWNVNTAAPCLGALCLVWCKTNTRTCSSLKQYHCRERICNEICRLIYIYIYISIDFFPCLPLFRAFSSSMTRYILKRSTAVLPEGTLNKARNMKKKIFWTKVIFSVKYWRNILKATTGWYHVFACVSLYWQLITLSVN